MWKKLTHSYRSSRSQMFFKRGVPKNLALFTRKCLEACNFIKRRLQNKCFPVNIEKILRTAFFIKHLTLLLMFIIIDKFTILIPFLANSPIFAKSSILDVRLGSGYSSGYMLGSLTEKLIFTAYFLVKKFNTTF